MSTDDKTTARDDNDKIMKSPEPNADMMIDPYVYFKTGRAVNYDRRWAGTVQLGPNRQNKLITAMSLGMPEATAPVVGVWVTTPFNRTGHGPIIEAFLAELKAAGIAKWPENCCYFTNDMGKAALRKYLRGVCIGRHKANAKSWGNKYAAMTGVSFQDLESANLEPIKQFLAKQGIDVEKVNWDSITATLRGLYKKTTSTYINKEEKARRITNYFNEKDESTEEFLESLSDDVSVDMPEVITIAEATGLTPKDVVKFMQEIQTKETIDSRGDEVVMLDDEDDVVTIQAEEVMAEIDIDEPTAEALDEIEEATHIDVTELDDEDEGVVEVPELGTSVAVAAVTTIEKPAPLTDEEATELNHAIAEVEAVTGDMDPSKPHERDLGKDKAEFHQVNPENLRTLRSRSFSDASVTEVTTESIGFKDDGQVKKQYLQSTPFGDWYLPEGTWLMGDADDGRVYLIVSVVAEV